MTATPFQYFVLLAAMRTGSNFLEESLNAVPGIACMGEAFNPVFIAYPNQSALLGMTMAERDARPLELLKRIRSVPGLPGLDRKSTRLNSSHIQKSRMPSSA